MLILRRVTPFHIAQRRIRINHAHIAQILQRHQVLRLASPIQPASTKRQRSKMFSYSTQQTLRFGHPQRYVSDLKILHIMRTLHIVMHDSFSSATERLYSVQLILLHPRRLSSLYDRH